MSPSRSGRRAVSPVVGVVLLVAVTVLLAASVGAVVLEVAEAGTVDPSGPTASLSLSADPATGRVRLTHRGGAPLSVEALTVRVAVDGTPLRHQPPVPFFSARGFRPGPTGPFNVAADGEWTAGETASFRLASTNRPTLSAGVRLTVRVSASGRSVAELSTRL